MKEETKAQKCMSGCKKFVFQDINFVKWLCTHILGEKHTLRHRMIVGALIMITGVFVSKLGVAHPALHYFTDMTGYFIHGIGGIPYIEQLSKFVKD